jgi:hypothetical protein
LLALRSSAWPTVCIFLNKCLCCCERLQGIACEQVRPRLAGKLWKYLGRGPAEHYA